MSWPTPEERRAKERAENVQWAVDELLRRSGYRQMKNRRDPQYCWVHPLDKYPHFTRESALAGLRTATECAAKDAAERAARTEAVQ